MIEHVTRDMIKEARSVLEKPLSQFPTFYDQVRQALQKAFDASPERRAMINRTSLAKVICVAMDDEWEREGSEGLIDAYGPVADAVMAFLSDVMGDPSKSVSVKSLLADMRSESEIAADLAEDKLRDMLVIHTTPIDTDDPGYHCPRCGLDDAGIRDLLDIVEFHWGPATEEARTAIEARLTTAIRERDEARAEISRITAIANFAQSKFEEERGGCIIAEAALMEAREVLRPFAAWATNDGDDGDFAILSLGECRRAALVLKNTEGGGE